MSVHVSMVLGLGRQKTAVSVPSTHDQDSLCHDKTAETLSSHPVQHLLRLRNISTNNVNDMST